MCTETSVTVCAGRVKIPIPVYSVCMHAHIYCIIRWNNHPLKRSSQQVNRNLEREYRDCIRSRRDKIGITRLMHQVLYNMPVIDHEQVLLLGSI